MSAGCSLLQFRRKGGDDRENLDDLTALVNVAHRTGCRVIVNDRVDFAILTGADGVHLGQEDIPPADARTMLGSQRLLGLSTHNQEQFEEGLDSPVDYLALGPVFSTHSKKQVDPVVEAALQVALVKRANLPVVAIGGIEPHKAGALYARGFASLAAIDAFAREPALAWRRFREAL